MNQAYKRAGLLLKVSLLLELALNTSLQYSMVGGALPLLILLCVCYFFAHMVQESRLWMKYPVMLYALVLGVGTGFQLASILETEDQTLTITITKISTLVLVLTLVIWAAILVFKHKHDAAIEEESYAEPNEKLNNQSDIG